MAPRIVEGSCWACRKRRLKCDLKQPCSKCTKSAAQCDYSQRQLQWVGGAAFRGRLKLMAVPLREQSLSQMTAPDMHVCRSPLTIPDSPMPLSPFLPETLILYFKNAVWPRLQLSEELISLDEEILIREPALREAVLAVSQAHHHLYFAGNLGTAVASGADSQNQARQVALMQFRRRIEDGVDSMEEACRLFQIVCMFCILDGVIAPDLKGNASEQHLKGGCSMLSTWTSMTTQLLLAGGLQTHLLSVFATVDLVHSLLSGNKPFFEPAVWSMFAGVQAWWGNLSCGDDFLKVLKLYSEVSFLGSIVRSQLFVADGYTLAERCVPTILASLASSGARSQTTGNAPVDCWDSFCTLYETSAIIYVYRALQGRRIDDEAVQVVVRQAVSTLLDKPLPGMMTHCLIFPLLVVGSHCLYAQDRKAVSDALSTSSSYLAFGNLILMADLLKNIWSKNEIDANWWNMFVPVSQNLFLF